MSDCTCELADYDDAGRAALHRFAVMAGELWETTKRGPAPQARKEARLLGWLLQELQ